MVTHRMMEDSDPGSTEAQGPPRAARPGGKRYRQELSEELLEADETLDFLRHPGAIPPLRVPKFDRLALPLPLEPPRLTETLGLPKVLELTARPDVHAMRERYASGDLEGALEAAEGVLRRDPLDPEARHYADRCRESLANRYRRRLGPRPLRLRLTLAKLKGADLEPRHAFVLSRIEGLSSVDEMLDACAMPAHEALLVLCELLDRGVLGPVT